MILTYRALTSSEGSGCLRGSDEQTASILSYVSPEGAGGADLIKAGNLTPNE
jgi:hypothetical protein